MSRSRLTEVTRPPSIDQAAAILRSAGYRRIGKGDYGRVYRRGHDPNVIKLFANTDRAYVAFLRYAVTHDSPHLPRFHGKLVRVNDAYSAIRMEYLTPLRSSDEELVYDVGAYMLALKNGPPIWPWIAEAITRLKTKQPTLFDLVTDITNKLIVGACFTGDPDNIMRRGDTLVVIDPICGRGIT